MAPNTKERTFADWVRTGLLSFAFFAIPGVLILRLGLRLSWSELAVPLVCFAVLQIIFSAAMFWLQRTRSIRKFTPIYGTYLALLFSARVHFASRWRVNIGFGPGDLRNLLILLLVLVIAVVLMPRRWTDSLWSEGVSCATCHHHHEGHDCACGCRVDQFKYPVFGI